MEEDEEEREELMDSPPLPPAPSPVPAPSLRPTRALPEGKTTCARLQAAWVLRKETSNSDNSEAIHELLSSSGTDLPHPAKNKGPLPSNRAFWLEFALFFFICAAFPYALVGLVFRKRWGYHKAADLGSFFGTNIAVRLSSFSSILPFHLLFSLFYPSPNSMASPLLNSSSPCLIPTLLPFLHSPPLSSHSSSSGVEASSARPKPSTFPGAEPARPTLRASSSSPSS